MKLFGERCINGRPEETAARRDKLKTTEESIQSIDL